MFGTVDRFGPCGTDEVWNWRPLGYVGTMNYGPQDLLARVEAMNLDSIIWT